MIPPPRDGPIHPDRLDHEGPLATKWGYLDPSASQRSLASGIGAGYIKLLVAPYVLVLRSRLPRSGKIAAIAALGVIYALAFAALAAALPPMKP
jgi:hypothetical protein